MKTIPLILWIAVVALPQTQPAETNTPAMIAAESAFNDLLKENRMLRSQMKAMVHPPLPEAPQPLMRLNKQDIWTIHVDDGYLLRHRQIRSLTLEELSDFKRTNGIAALIWIVPKEK